MRLIPVFLSACLFCVTCAAELSVKPSPGKAVETETPSVKVDCRLTREPSDWRFAISLKIVHHDVNGTMSLIAEADINTDEIVVPEPNRTKAKGDLRDVPYHLAVHIAQPEVGDSGMYECILLYLTNDEEEPELKEIKETADLVVAEPAEDFVPVVAPVISPESQCECDRIWEEIDNIKDALKERPSSGKAIILPAAASECQVSFSAYFKRRYGYVIYDKEQIHFDHTRTNKGGAYDTSTGMFTAPCDGQYFFNVALRTNQNLDSGYVDGVLLVDDVPVARTHVYTDVPILNRELATTGTVVSLTQGQKVKVMLESTSSGSVQGDEFSLFSGFFISP